MIWCSLHLEAKGVWGKLPFEEKSMEAFAYFFLEDLFKTVAFLKERYSSTYVIITYHSLISDVKLRRSDYDLFIKMSSFAYVALYR